MARSRKSASEIVRPAVPPTISVRFDWMRLGLGLVAILCVAGAILHSIAIRQVDDTTAKFLGLTAAVLVLHQVNKFEFMGMKIEQVRDVVRQEMQPVNTRVNMIEDQGLLPGRPQIVPAKGERESKVSREMMPAVVHDENDPNKGNFGGSPIADGRMLSATIDPAAGQDSPACKVHFKVESIDREKPLTGKVTFHLHPTFGQWKKYDVDVINGVAEDTMTSWGAFTLGAETDSGQTRLELDLMTVKGGTKRFYEE